MSRHRVYRLRLCLQDRTVVFDHRQDVADQQVDLSLRHHLVQIDLALLGRQELKDFVVVADADCRVVHQDADRLGLGQVVQGSGVDCKVELVAPRSLPFTSSGKLSRAGARAKYLAGEMVVFAAPVE